LTAAARHFGAYLKSQGSSKPADVLLDEYEADVKHPVATGVRKPRRNANAASVPQPSTTRRDAEPSGQESSLHNGADYECSGQEPRRSPVRPISNGPDPKRDSDLGAVVPSQP
jgi:hypothetical protein